MIQKIKNLNITFNRVNYLMDSTGSSRFANEINELYKEANFSNLLFFNIRKAFLKQYVGVILDKKFIGIIKQKNIYDFLCCFFEKYNVENININIQHLLYFDIENISYVLYKLNKKFTLFVHDFYYICSSFFLLNSKGDFCGFETPNRKKCFNCSFYNNAIKHINKIKDLIKLNNNNINFIVCPSSFVKKVFDDNYTNLKHKIIVRPHLKISGNCEYNVVKNKIHLAYVGALDRHKGIEFFKELVEYISVNNLLEDYELYVFTSKKCNIKNVKWVKVEIAKEGNDSMIKSLINHNIHTVFMWNQCPETYSYTYFESSLAGSFIISNEISGNINLLIKDNKNGIILKDMKEVKKLIFDIENFRNIINNFRTKDGFHPSKFESNKDLNNILIENQISIKDYKYKKININYFLSFLYQVKYMVKKYYKRIKC